MVRRKYSKLQPELDERSVRIWAATEAESLGYGGIAIVMRATGLARNTIAAGLRELHAEEAADSSRIRRSGGGRKRLDAVDPTLVTDLLALVDPLARGDPMNPLRWTTQSTRTLSKALATMGHRVSHVTVRAALVDAGYSLQSNRKSREGSSHPDRDAQFHHINRRVRQHQRCGSPVISVDAKKKELVGDFKNAGTSWRPKGDPQLVRVHDFVIEGQGKAIPYGIYDVTQNEGWVSVGVDHDTATFAVASIRRWWDEMGRSRYPHAREILITADGGGSNGHRLRLWKLELQGFADATGLKIRVSHLPPGTSKWNKIEHRLFSFISKNWRGRPLETLAIIVNLIGATTTEAGLRVRCELDTGEYPKGRKVTAAEMDTINLRRGRFHCDWNYTIAPRVRRQRAPL